MRPTTLLLLLAGWMLLPLPLPGQVYPADTASGLTLEQCIAFALKHTPALTQSRLDEEIADREVKESLAGWYPQVTARYNVQRYLRLPVSFVPDFSDLSSDRMIPVTFGVANNSNALFQADQVLYSNEVWLASRASRFVRLQSRQNVQATRINTVVVVTKAYYDVLLTQAQLQILDEAILRLEKQLKDAYSQFESGTVDETDYQRATIALGNARSDRRQVAEAVGPKKTLLKELMGDPSEGALQLVFDARRVEEDLLVDTLHRASYANRIEYQLLQSQKALQKLSVGYHQWNFLPTLSAFANYNLVYQNQSFRELYSQTFPTSVVGLSATVPLFQGGRRIHNLRKAQLLDRRLDVELDNARQRIRTEYEQALGSYKSALTEWNTVKSNAVLAEKVYRTTKLQYDEGIKTYLELIVAETDLRTTQFNYYNALYRVLSGKLDLQRAQGTVPVQ
ncbi:MAG: TolC family protein [Cytophagales bacterium]|nr:TolC family protein [Cytophagales bacterium]